MAPVQRGPYQRALSVDAKPMGGEGGVGGGLAGRRNVPCPTLVKQENMEAPIRAGNVANGFPGGIGVCPPRGGATSNLPTLFTLAFSKYTAWLSLMGPTETNSMGIFLFHINLKCRVQILIIQYT